jgi:hypothetical protein
MTGYSDDVALRGSVAPGVPVVHKPFRPRDLLGKVRTVLDGA